MGTFGIIGGTGIYAAEGGAPCEELFQDTPYGRVKLLKQEYKGHTVYFLNRHGEGHSVPPHKINYRANVWALKEVGADTVLATAAVGSLNKDMPPGDFVFPDQFLEFTKMRHSTFFEGGESGVVHRDMTNVFCPELRSVYEELAGEIGHKYFNGGTYVCTEGPRYETPAEIKMYAGFGADIVGMTAYPEAPLARELGLCYATLAFVTNYAAGISPLELTHEEVKEATATVFEDVQKILFGTVERICGREERNCTCADTPEPM